MTPEYKTLDGAVRRSPECMWDHEDYEVRVQFQSGYEIPEEIFNNNDVDDEG